MENEVRKQCRYGINSKGYMFVRVDLAQPALALWYLEEAIDVLKMQVNAARQKAAADAKRMQVEIAKADTTEFINKKMK